MRVGGDILGRSGGVPGPGGVIPGLGGLGRGGLKRVLDPHEQGADLAAEPVGPGLGGGGAGGRGAHLLGRAP